MRKAAGINDRFEVRVVLGAARGDAVEVGTGGAVVDGGGRGDVCPLFDDARSALPSGPVVGNGAGAGARSVNVAVRTAPQGCPLPRPLPPRPRLRPRQPRLGQCLALQAAVTAFNFVSSLMSKHFSVARKG